MVRQTPVDRRGRHACRTFEAGSPGAQQRLRRPRRPQRRHHAGSCWRWQRSAVMGAAAVAGAAPAGAHGRDRRGGGKARGKSFRLTVLGTTDTHGNVFNWDYFKDAEYDDSAHNDIGLAKVATLVKPMRAERGGRASCSPSTRATRSRARRWPTTTPRSSRSPAARCTRWRAAMNAIGYDAAALGNHEFNYGIDTLRDVRVAAATSRCWPPTRSTGRTGAPAFPPYVIKTFELAHGTPTCKVGILGLTNPGHRDLGQGATSRARWSSPAWSSRPRSACRELKRAGVRRRHRRRATPGPTPSSSYGDALPYPRTPARWSPSRCPASTRSWSATRTRRSRSASSPTRGPASRCCCPSRCKWGMRLPVMDFDLEQAATAAGRSTTAHAAPAQLQHRAEDPRGVAGCCAQHHTRRRLRQLGDRHVAPRRCRRPGAATRTRRRSTSSTSCRPTRSRRPWPAPPTPRCRCCRSPRRSTATRAFPAGDVTMRDVAGLYIYDNTLLGVRLTGAQVQGLPGVLGAVLQAGHRHRPVRPGRT